MKHNHKSYPPLDLLAIKHILRKLQVAYSDTCTGDIFCPDPQICYAQGTTGSQLLTLNNSTGDLSITNGNNVNLVQVVKNFETITNYTTNVVGGKVIGNYVNEAGTTQPISETITSLVDNGNNTITYVNESGTITTISIAPVSPEATTVADTATLDLTLTGTQITGVVKISGTSGNDISSDTTGIYLNVEDEETTTNVIPVVLVGNTVANYTNEDGLVQPIKETITTLVANANGTVSYTNESGVVVTSVLPTTIEKEDHFPNLLSGTTVTLTSTPTANPWVFRNGRYQRIGVDFTIAGTVITFVTSFGYSSGGTAPEDVIVRYNF